MQDQLSKFQVLQDAYSALENAFKDSVLESKFEKELSVKVKMEDLLLIVRFLKSEKGFNALNDIIGLDNLSNMAEGQKRFSIIYQLYKYPDYQRIRLVIDVNEGESVDSITSVYNAANWAEREIFDMFGINFIDHPNMRRIYMPDTFTGFPLRKDFPLEGNN